MSIPTFVSISEAASRTGATPAQIQHLADAGKIRAARVSSGILVAMEDLKRVVDREDFSHLDGVAIHISEAARKYKLQQGSISGWRRAGHIRTIGRDKNRILIDEGDVAYIRAVIDAVGLRPGQPLSYILEK